MYTGYKNILQIICNPALNLLQNESQISVNSMVKTVLQEQISVFVITIICLGHVRLPQY